MDKYKQRDRYDINPEAFKEKLIYLRDGYHCEGMSCDDCPLFAVRTRYDFSCCEDVSDEMIDAYVKEIFK